MLNQALVVLEELTGLAACLEALRQMFSVLDLAYNVSDSLYLGWPRSRDSVFARPHAYCFHLASISSCCLGDCLRLATNILDFITADD